MRFATSSLQTLAVVLLAKDVVAAVHGRHADYHHQKRDMLTVTDDVWVTLTEDIVETVTDTCFVTVYWSEPGSQPTSMPAAITTLTATTMTTTASAAPTVPLQAAIRSTSSSAPVAVPTTMATVVKPTTSAPAAQTSAAPAPASGSKRGIAYNDASLTDPFNSGKVTWAYNWDSSPDGNIRAGLEFVPMLWGLQHTGDWSQKANAAIASGSTHLLGFNEPDLDSQSNMDVGSAVAGWKQYMEPFAGKATLISPAVTNGGAPMGIAWLTSFLQQCSGCNVGCVALHWYAGADQLQYFKDHVTEAHTATGKCIWVTEFQAITGSPDQVSAFLSAAMAWMDEQPFVERYAYFMASQGNLVNGNGLSALGSVFNS